MRFFQTLPAIGALLLFSKTDCLAHLIGDTNQDGVPPHYDISITPPTNIVLNPNPAALSGTNHGAAIVAAFQPFAPKVRTHWDDTFFYVESDGLPTHQMMVGITAWQQQVPLPQNYTGDNAWRFPLNPVPAAQPQTIRNHFLRGAIAIAVNGVPIFNPQNNRGEISAEIGELDQYGGHAGRADDYHYHVVPLYLQKYVGSNNPVAFALDGYPIYGLTEPDGSTPTNLDEFHGHYTPGIGYHYLASTNYPYVIGGFHGVVTERDGQVDPQPHAQPVRPATEPLRGAIVTDFATETDGKSYTVSYRLYGQLMKLHYGADAGVVRFELTDASGKTTMMNYPTHFKPEPIDNPPPPDGPDDQRPPRDPNRQPWLKVHAKEMDLNHDGILTRAEFITEVDNVFAALDRNHDGRLTADEYGSPPVRSPMGGYIKQHYKELLDETGIITKASLMKEAMRMFDKTDLNHDGQLTPDEIALPPGYKAEPPGGQGANPPPDP